MKMSTVAIYNSPNREQPKDSMMRGKIKKSMASVLLQQSQEFASLFS